MPKGSRDRDRRRAARKRRAFEAEQAGVLREEQRLVVPLDSFREEARVARRRRRAA